MLEHELETMNLIVSIIGKKGPITVNVGLNDHLDEPYDNLDDNFIIGEKGKDITIGDVKLFLRRLEKYCKTPLINKAYYDGRSFIFEGVRKVGPKSYDFLWGS